MVVAIHTGMGWTETNPEKLAPVVDRHPDTRFDIYHLVPYARQAALLAKNSPNVWLNLCWSHVNLVPVTKISVFGGDYTLHVENIYGHLAMARENVAWVLAGRIQDGLINEEQAMDIAGLWFYENPRQLYRLEL